jgi:CTP synthase
VHASAKNDCKVKIHRIQSEKITDKNVEKMLIQMDGIFVAPGFGNRGIEGKIAAIKYAREKQIPFFGVCLGMQCATIEFARNVLKIENATSREFDTNTNNAVIDLMQEQKNVKNKGGTMRLGSYPCALKQNSISYNAYWKEQINERHRHRYEFNNDYLERFEKAGMIASGFNPEKGLVEIIELKGHPWFVGVQFHPEYKSTILHPHPLFVSFINAAIQFRNKSI